MITPYQQTAERILAAAMADQGGWDKLHFLCHDIGHRLCGSAGLARAIEWVNREMQAEGLDHAVLQPIKVPHWVRGQESAVILSPVQRPLRMLGLGGSVATPPEGLSAPVVVVRDFEALEALGRTGVEGKIVVYACDWIDYGHTVKFRVFGASRASRLGSVAALVRSVTNQSRQSIHTGGINYEEGVAPIPVAALAIEDVEWLRQQADAGHEIRIRLTMGARNLPETDSANVIGQLTGTEKPEEIVVMGGHIDCWDLGHGAHDDGAACMAAWQALTLLKQLGLRPRRTLRVVLWTNEENGLRGGLGYREALGEDVRHHVAALEMDGGCECPCGFGLGLDGIDPNAGDPRYEAAYATLCQIGAMLKPIGADEVVRGGSAADIRPLMSAGVPGLRLNSAGGHYLKWHHADTDTLDQIEPGQFRKAIALFALYGYVLADMPSRLVPPGGIRQ